MLTRCGSPAVGPLPSQQSWQLLLKIRLLLSRLLTTLRLLLSQRGAAEMAVAAGASEEVAEIAVAAEVLIITRQITIQTPLITRPALLLHQPTNQKAINMALVIVQMFQTMPAPATGRKVAERLIVVTLSTAVGYILLHQESEKLASSALKIQTYF